MAIDEYIDFENEIEEKESQSISNEVRKPTGKSVSFFSHPIKYTLMAVGAAYMALAPGAPGVTQANAGEKLVASKASYNTSHNSYQKLPNLQSAKFLGQKGPIDIVNNIPGKETIIKGYKLGSKQIITYQLENGKIFGFGIRANGTDVWFTDKNNTGSYERLSSKKVFLNTKKYGYN